MKNGLIEFSSPSDSGSLRTWGRRNVNGSILDPILIVAEVITPNPSWDDSHIISSHHFDVSYIQSERLAFNRKLSLDVVKTTQR